MSPLDVAAILKVRVNNQNNIEAFADLAALTGSRLVLSSWKFCLRGPE
jgi:hypothetical protein